MAEQAPVVRYDVGATCETCGKELVQISTTDEAEAREGVVRAISAGEIHDCKKSGKGP
jgi:hypothetical protein